MSLKVSGETAKSFVKRRDIDAPLHELMPLINIENQNALAGPLILLSRTVSADVQLPFGLRLARGAGCDCQQNRNKRDQQVHG